MYVWEYDKCKIHCGFTSHNMLGWAYIMISALVTSSYAGTADVCTGDQFTGSCPRGEVLIIDQAEYGRMEPGRCGITSEGGHIGCSNDILYLADSKCSGRRECDFIVGTTEFNEANTECRELRAYMRIAYSCIKVVYDDQGPCLTDSPHHITSHEGFIGSHVTDETGCGSLRAPWVITAMPGQTIDLSLMDFGALSRDNQPYQSLCANVYGYIVESSLGVNKTICGGMLREESMYSSKSNTVEIHIIPRGQRQDDNCFVVSYEVIGCSDLTPPANAYYKREGKDAVIGCEGTDTTWRLTCQGNRWDGVVGNCSAQPYKKPSSLSDDLPLKTMLVVAGICGATVVLAVLMIVCGVVYIKKYRHDREMAAGTPPGSFIYRTRSRSSPGTSTLPTGVTTLPPGGSTLPVRISPQYHAMLCARNDPRHPHHHLLQHHASPTLASTTHKPRLLLPSTGAQIPPPPTGNGPPLTHIWENPMQHHHNDVTMKSSEGIYENPSEVCTCSTRKIRPTTSSDSENDTDNDNVNDNDDIDAYYAANGHKYFVLERQPDATDA